VEIVNEEHAKNGASHDRTYDRCTRQEEQEMEQKIVYVRVYLDSR